MSADYYDDTKNLKLFIRIFNFLIVLIGHVQLQLQTTYVTPRMKRYPIVEMELLP